MSLDDFFDEGPREGTTPPVPAIAAKAADLEAYRKSVEESAAVSCGLWLSYLFVLFYLGVAAGAVTHADLLLQNPVKLPFLSIELPLLAFFFVAPVLLVITHAYTLVNLALLADRVREFHKELGDQLRADLSLQPRAAKIRSVWTRQLPSNIFVQFLGGPDEILKRGLGKTLAVILWVTLAVAPIGLLLLLQIQFLPYHSRWITWTNRIALVGDLGLLLWLWGKVLRIRSDVSKTRSSWLWLQTSGFALASVCVILFAGVIATIPDEWQEKHLSFQASNLLRRWIFDGEVDLTTRRRTGLFSNKLVIPAFNIYEARKIDDPKKVEWKQHLIDLRGRDLRGAVLAGATLPKADLTGAQLQGASLGDAQLQGASLDGAQLQGTSLRAAHLQGASLYGANLQGARLDFAQLQGALLDHAQLRGAWLGLAKLQGSSLYHAQLQGASLQGAQLQGALLSAANLQGARLDFAHLQGASLTGAELQGTNLADAPLWRAQLQNSVLENIFDTGAEIHWSPIAWVPYWTGVSLANAQPWTDETYAQLRQTIEREVPEEPSRSDALRRVAILDCGKTDYNALASCDPSHDPPEAVKQWKKMIEAASVDPDRYAKALSAILGNLVCTINLNSDLDIPMIPGASIVTSTTRGSIEMTIPPRTNDQIYVLRGLLHTYRVADTGAELPALIKRITSTDCPVSMALTGTDGWYIAKNLEQAAKSS
jgi:uncharacterized protein YjbI with pentapeptide repeats